MKKNKIKKVSQALTIILEHYLEANILTELLLETLEQEGKNLKLKPRRWTAKNPLWLNNIQIHKLKLMNSKNRSKNFAKLSSMWVYLHSKRREKTLN